MLNQQMLVSNHLEKNLMFILFGYNINALTIVARPESMIFES